MKLDPKLSFTPAYWQQISRDATIESPSRKIDRVEGDGYHRTFLQEGFCRLPIASYNFDLEGEPNLFSLLRGKDIHPAFLWIWDAPWDNAVRYSSYASHVLGSEVAFLPCLWAWDIKPGASGFRPHRDRGRKSLRADGTPFSCTVWFAASNMNGAHISILPKDADPVYGTPEEDRKLDWEPLLHRIRNLSSAGSASVYLWDQSVLHWSSGPAWGGGRRSYSIEYQAIDGPAELDHPLLRCQAPSLGVRVRLIAKNILQLKHLDPTIGPDEIEWAEGVLK